jgi:hypothetical protein
VEVIQGTLLIVQQDIAVYSAVTQRKSFGQSSFSLLSKDNTCLHF